MICKTVRSFTYLRGVKQSTHLSTIPSKIRFKLYQNGSHDAFKNGRFNIGFTNNLQVRTLFVKSANTLHGAIVEGFHSSLKSDYWVPNKLAVNRAGFPRQGRQSALQSVYDSFVERKNFRKTSNPSDRQNNPLTACHGPTGGGKSFFLDEVAALKSEDIKLCEDNEMVDILSKSLAITITYNAQTTYNEQADRDAETGIALRMLYSFYFKSPEHWLKFAEFCLHKREIITINDACEIIFEALGKQVPVILLVDEVIKSGGLVEYDTVKVAKVLSAIGSQLSNMSNFNAVITTLNVDPFTQVRTGSGRPILWTVLPPLSITESLSLFPKEYVERYFSLSQCIIDCNGHARSLEALSLLCNSRNWKLPNEPAVLMDYLVDYINSKSLSILQPPLDLVKASLLGNSVLLSSTAFIDNLGVSRSYQQSIALGYLQNHIEGDHQKMIVPTLSPLLLNMWAKFNFEYPELRDAVLRLLRLEVDFTWMSYERFHANWEILWQELNKNKSLTLREYYKLDDPLHPLRPNFSSMKNVSFISQGSQELSNLANNFPGDSGEAILVGNNHKLSLQEIQKSVLVPAINNPAFDIAIIKENFMLAIECRYSDPTSSKSLSSNEIKLKNQLLYETLQPHIGKYNLSMKQVYHIFCAYRKVPNSLHCIVL